MSDPKDIVSGFVQNAVNTAAVKVLESKIERLEAELADLRASSVVVRMKCKTCDGSGRVNAGPPGETWPYDEPCPDCGNGWQLAEGVINGEDT